MIPSNAWLTRHWLHMDVLGSWHGLLMLGHAHICTITYITSPMPHPHLRPHYTPTQAPYSKAELLR